ncbi:unnamed protein product [Gulo gulo]|uniref:Uncharacterized protein n=1 Tax=Gulo gulo TaxID=48420 RepID=A0A9X9LM85_GULGU|nr:unnamed protein product [Gulo gulo]
MFTEKQWQIWNSCSARTHTLFPTFRKKWLQNWRYISQYCRFGSRSIEQSSRKPNNNMVCLAWVVQLVNHLPLSRFMSPGFWD